jgi:serine/threonine-protein kinase RsbW
VVVSAVDPPAKRRLHQFRVAADVDRLAEVRAFVRDSVAAFGGSKRAAEDLVQAVDEATCNVMLHGYDGKPGEIELEAALRDGSVEIRILDRAPIFDPTALPHPTAHLDPAVPPATPRRGRHGTAGVGLHLARTMTDSVRHHVRPGGGNELTLVRSIGDQPSEEA